MNGVILEATLARDEASWRRLLRAGLAAYRVEARGAARRRTHLQSAKILDGAGAFVCHALIADVSDSGIKLVLGRNCGVPMRFGVHLDLTGEIVTAALAWRRDAKLGARVVGSRPPAPLRRSDRAALRGRYYAVPN